jgi:hypothetical protein
VTCSTHSFGKPFVNHFQSTPGAAWAVAYCRCGAVQWHVLNPKANQPITEDQPL